MADSDAHIPHTPPLLLPDAIHQAVKPGTALLRLETTSSREESWTARGGRVHGTSKPNSLR